MRVTRRFQPRLWPTLGTLVGLAILLSLGTWQYNRYREKLDIEAVRDARTQMPQAVVSRLIAEDLDELGYRRVQLRGRLDTARTILFKHRQYEGRPGFWLATPLRLEGGGAILVNRGWLPFGEARELAEELRGEPELATFNGLLYVLPRNIADTRTRAALARGDISLDGQITEWSTYDVEAISEALPYEVVHPHAVLVLDASHRGDPFPLSSMDYVTSPYMTSERHQGYSIFWYTTAGALVLLYIAASLGLVGSYRRRASDPAPAPREDEASA